MARLLGIEEKAGNAGPISESISVEDYNASGISAPIDLQDYATATTNLSWLYRALHLKASNASMVKPKFFKKGTDQEITSGPAVDLFERINAQDTYFSFMYRTYFDLDWAGEFVWEFAKVGNRVSAMTTISPQRIKPIPSASGIGQLLVDVGGTDDTLSKGDFLYNFRYNPTNRYRGLSVIQSLAHVVSVDWNIQLRLEDLIKKGGVPAGVLSFPDVLGKAQSKQIRNDWNRIHGASTKAGQTAILSGGAKYDRISLTPYELQILDIRKFTRDEIATVTGVPPFMLGNESATYSNATEQRQVFWHETMLPTIKGEVFGAINENLMPLIQAGVEARPDLSGVEKLLETETARVENATKGFQRGILSRNEARKAMGAEPIIGGDIFLDPLNSRIVDEAGEPVHDPTAITLDAEVPVTKETEEPVAKVIDEARERRKSSTYARFINQRNRTLRSFNSILRKELRTRRDRIVESIRGWDGGGIPEIPLNEERDGAELFRAIRPTASEAVGASADDWGDELSKEKSIKATAPIISKASEEDFEVDNPQVRAWLDEQLLKYCQGMTEGQLMHLRQVLADNVAGEIDLYQLGTEIQSADIAFTEVQTRRAVQTWSSTAINLGAMEAGRRFGTPRKSWISQRIGEPREWHISLENDAPIKHDAFFQTPYGVLQYPADGNASPKDLYNCSCVLLNEE